MPDKALNALIAVIFLLIAVITYNSCIIREERGNIMKAKYVSPQITRVKLNPEQAILGMCDEESANTQTLDQFLCVMGPVVNCKSYKDYSPPVGAGGYTCKEARS